jgi:peroxiredoxin
MNHNVLTKPLVAVMTALSLFACGLIGITAADDSHLEQSYSDLAVSSIMTGNAPKDFTLSDSSGQQVNLENALQTQNILLIFYRGDWCPYCIDQFSTIQSVLPELKEYNVKLLAVSPDEVSAAKNTKRQFGQGYTFLSDSKLEVTKAYGIASEKSLPHPAVYLLKQADAIAESEVVWMYASTDHTTRPNGEQLLAKIKTVFAKVQ